MARLVRRGACPQRRCLSEADDAVAALVAWPGLARPPTPGGADTANDVDGRHKPALGRAKGWARGAGHDTGAAGPALSAPLRTSRAMTTWGRPALSQRDVSTCLRSAVSPATRANRHIRRDRPGGVAGPVARRI